MKTILAATSIVAILAFAIYLKTSNYRECRAFGHSRWYCWQLISK